jgi:hypothetical protein
VTPVAWFIHPRWLRTAILRPWAATPVKKPGSHSERGGATSEREVAMPDRSTPGDVQVDLPDAALPVWRRGDPVALSFALAVITLSALVGRELNQRGVPIVLPSPPLIAQWHPHLGWGTPLAILAVVVGLDGCSIWPGWFR